MYFYVFCMCKLIFFNNQILHYVPYFAYNGLHRSRPTDWVLQYMTSYFPLVIFFPTSNINTKNYNLHGVLQTIEHKIHYQLEFISSLYKTTNFHIKIY